MIPRSLPLRRPCAGGGTICSQSARARSGTASARHPGCKEKRDPAEQAAAPRRVEGGTVVLLRLIALGLALLASGCSDGSWLPAGGYSMNAEKLAALERTYSKANGVPEQLVRAVVDAESHGNPYAVSRAGAQGLMQLMPATQALYGVCDPFDPAANVDGGTRYLHDLLVRYHHDTRLALAAYNAGPGAVAFYHGIPPFAETRSYLARVSAELGTF
jgi:soluble lytic murein transglycosylase-like protein